MSPAYHHRWLVGPTVLAALAAGIAAGTWMGRGTAPPPRQALGPGTEERPPVVPEGEPFRRNIGEVCTAEEVVQEFAYRNVGDRPLHLLRVETNCPCTSHAVSAYEIGPGACGTIALTTRVNEPLVYERWARISADLTFQGYAQPLSLACDLLMVRDLPAVVDFGTLIAGGPPAPLVFQARPCTGPADYVRVDSDHPSVTAELLPPGSDSGSRPVLVELNPPETPGLLVANLSFHGPAGDRAVRQVAVRATLRPRIEAEPDSLVLGTVPAGSQRAYSLAVVGRVEQPFDILSVRSSVDGLATRWSRADTAGRRWNVQVTFAPGNVVGGITGSLEIATSDRRCPLVVVPVCGVCVPATAETEP